jgi:hypothetical protein
MGYAEAAAGIGLLLGPTSASFIYGYLGYSGTFYAFGVF